MLVRERQSADPDRGPHSGDHRRRAARRGVFGVLAGALIMLVAASALAATGRDVTILGMSDGSGTSTEGGGLFSFAADEPPPLTTEPGRCLTWDRADGSDVREVDCAESHLFEVVGPATAPLPPGAPFPADDAWQQLVDEQCTPMARNYLQGRLDPSGRYRAGALKPTPDAWQSGERTVRCGLQAPGRTGALFTSTGRVADADQAVVYDAGTCLGLDGREVSDPVNCERTHAAEVAGTVDLGQEFPGGVPSVDDQDNYLQPTCQRIAEEHAGGAQRLTDSRLTVYWTNVSEESWDAGTRRVGCNLGALLEDGSGFAPLTGSLAGGVTIGGEIAPDPEPLPEPGAPAGRSVTGEEVAPVPAPEAPVAPPAEPAPVVPPEDAPAPEPSAPRPSFPTLPSLPLPLPGR